MTSKYDAELKKMVDKTCFVATMKWWQWKT